MEKSYWYKDSVIYQIYPLSFKDSNSDGYGDIRGIISKLDYIKTLGIDAIRLFQLFDASSLYTISPNIGTTNDLKELIDECHKINLKVILDIPVYDESIELIENIKELISLKVDGFILCIKTLKNKKIFNILNESIFKERDLFITVEPYNKKYLKNDNIDTIIDYSIFKSDTKFNNQFLKRKFNLIKLKKGLFKNQIKYFNKYSSALILENINSQRSNSRFGINYHDYWFEATTMLPLITYFTKGIPFIYQGQEIGIINTPFTRIEELKDPLSISTYNKLLKIFKPKKAFEIVKSSASDNVRTPMQWNQSAHSGFSDITPWMMVNPTYPLINLYVDQNIDNSIYYFYKDLIRIRKNNSVFLNGNIKEYNHLNKYIIVYKRYEEDEVFVISNFSDKQHNYKLPKEIRNKNLSVLISNYKDNDINNNSINLRPYEALLIKVE